MGLVFSLLSSLSWSWVLVPLAQAVCRLPHLAPHIRHEEVAPSGLGTCFPPEAPCFPFYLVLSPPCAGNLRPLSPW